MPVVLLIRHAQASFGAHDYDVLSELGHRQVAALHHALARRGIVPARIACGALRRQRDTAGTAWACEVDVRWNEYDDDDILGHHSDTELRLAAHDGGPTTTSREFQVALDAALQRWIDAGAGGPARETWTGFRERTTDALADFADGLRRGETGIAFSSSGVIAALAAGLAGAPRATFVNLNRVSVNTAITKVLVGSRGMTLASYNEHAHLEGAAADLVTYR